MTEELNELVKMVVNLDKKVYSDLLQSIVEDLFAMDYEVATDTLKEERRKGRLSKEVLDKLYIPMPDEVELKAEHFARKAHEGQTRKMSNLPFVNHLELAADFSKQIMLEQFGHIKDYIVATAWLHDTVEDTNVSIEEIKLNFGSRIAHLVDLESEDKREDRPATDTWRERKEEQLEELKSIPKEDEIVLIVTLSDKKANAVDLVDSYNEMGNDMWQHFNNSNIEDQRWYYMEFHDIIADSFLGGSSVLKEYKDDLDYIFGYLNPIEKREFIGHFLKGDILDFVVISKINTLKNVEILSITPNEKTGGTALIKSDKGASLELSLKYFSDFGNPIDKVNGLTRYTITLQNALIGTTYEVWGKNKEDAKEKFNSIKTMLSTYTQMSKIHEPIE